jgi:hypothetical protein
MAGLRRRGVREFVYLSVAGLGDGRWFPLGRAEIGAAERVWDQAAAINAGGKRRRLL